MKESIHGGPPSPGDGKCTGDSRSPATGAEFEFGGHVSCIYGKPEERDEVLLRFLWSGMESGGNVLYVGEPSVVESLRARMNGGDVHVRRPSSGGRVKVVPAVDVRPRGGAFDPDRLIALVNDEAELAASEGRSALWVSWDMGELFECPGDSGCVLECESILDSFSRNRKCSILCLYDRLRFEPDILAAVVMSHPSVLLGTEVCDNPHFIPPRELSRGEVKALALDFVVRALLSRREGVGAPGNGEREYRQLLESIQHGVVIVDLEGNFLDCNEAAHRCMGYTREEFLSLDMFKIAAPGSRDITVEDRERLLRGETIVVHRNICRKDGTVIPAEIRVRSVQYRGGKVLLAVVHDLTQEVKTKTALEEIKCRYQKICSALTDYAFTVRVEDGRPVETAHNPASVTLTGYAPEELTSAPDSWLGIVHEDDRAAVGGHLSRILAGETVEMLEHRIVCKDGDVRWVECTMVPHRDSRGEIVTFDCLIRDATERNRAREELKQSEEKFARAFYDCGQVRAIT